MEGQLKSELDEVNEEEGLVIEYLSEDVSSRIIEAINAEVGEFNLQNNERLVQSEISAATVYLTH